MPEAYRAFLPSLRLMLWPTMTSGTHEGQKALQDIFKEILAARNQTVLKIRPKN